jgi:hypothetical protein
MERSFILLLILASILSPFLVSKAHAVVQASNLTVTIDPLSASILVGQSTAFTSTVSGGKSPYSYQWYVDGNPVLGATSKDWMFTSLSEGIYYVYLQVTDVNSTAQSKTARIVVADCPVGGDSISFAKYTPVKPLSVNFYLLLVISLVFFLVAFKRKRQWRRQD